MSESARLLERYWAMHASFVRLKRLAESVAAYSFPDLEERKRALEEAAMVEAQHNAFEAPFKPFG